MTDAPCPRSRRKPRYTMHGEVRIAFLVIYPVLSARTGFPWLFDIYNVAAASP